MDGRCLIGGGAAESKRASGAGWMGSSGAGDDGRYRAPQGGIGGNASDQNGDVAVVRAGSSESDQMPAGLGGSKPHGLELKSRTAPAITKALYPLQYKPRHDSTGSLICRFYNYGTCHKAACRYSHVECHYCGKPGHIALSCPTASSDRAPWISTSLTPGFNIGCTHVEERFECI